MDINTKVLFQYYRSPKNKCLNFILFGKKMYFLKVIMQID